jgi:hypothetical protein
MASLATLGQARHNVGRVPELDFFVRKLFGEAVHWSKQCKYNKAGEARPFPGRFSSAEEYLGQMQAHAALEFQVITLHCYWGVRCRT